MDDSFIVFLENRPFDQGSLEHHLAYLKRELGTPDMWTSGEDLVEISSEAKEIAENQQCRAVVTNASYDIITQFRPQ